MPENTISLYNADCYEKIKDISDNSVDLVIIDPPYLYTTAKGGGAFGSKKRSYHAEYDSVSQHTPLDQRKRKNREEIRVISSGFNYGLFDELCRVLKKVNIYVWCSKMQVSSILIYFEKKGCSIDILTWHKTNPTPTMNNTYANDTEYLIFAREKGVRVNGTYHTKRKYYVTPTNYLKNFVDNKKLCNQFEPKGGGYTRLFYGEWYYRRGCQGARPQFYRYRDR